MKKIFKLVLVIVVAMAVFAASGCGKPAEQQAYTDDPNQEVKLVWYNYGGESKDLPLVLAEVNKYLKQKINATMEMKLVEHDYDQKIVLATTAGEQIDLMFTASWANDYRANATKGILLPVNELLKEYGQDILKIDSPTAWEGTAIKGVNYAVPCNKDIATQVYYCANKKLVDECGVDMAAIKKLTDWEPYFAKMKAKHPDFYGTDVSLLHMPYLMLEYDYLLDKEFPGAVRTDDASCKVINQYEDKAFLDRIKAFREFYKKGYIRTDAPTQFVQIWNPTNKCMMRLAEYLPQAQLDWERDWGFQVVMKPEFAPAMITSRSVSGMMIGISSSSKNPARAMKFLNLLWSDPYLQNLFAFGIEGVHYKKINDKQVELLPKAADYPIWKPTLGNMFIQYIPSYQTVTVWDEVKKFNDTAKKSPLLGFSFDSSKVNTEMAAVTNVIKEYTVPILCGSVDPDTAIKTFLDKARANGLDKIMAEMQRQVDEWKKTKK